MWGASGVIATMNCGRVTIRFGRELINDLKLLDDFWARRGVWILSGRLHSWQRIDGQRTTSRECFKASKRNLWRRKTYLDRIFSPMEKDRRSPCWKRCRRGCVAPILFNCSEPCWTVHWKESAVGLMNESEAEYGVEEIQHNLTSVLTLSRPRTSGRVASGVTSQRHWETMKTPESHKYK